MQSPAGLLIRRARREPTGAQVELIDARSLLHDAHREAQRSLALIPKGARPDYVGARSEPPVARAEHLRARSEPPGAPFETKGW